jgi:biopolymer transport protein ExbB
VAIERFIGLRKNRVVPQALIVELGRLGIGPSGFDPRQAYRLCQVHPSAAATVIRAMLLKVGRPHSEVEHAVAETSDREANRLYSNVRWLNFSAAVAPLLGLLGTVWGLIVCFHDTTHLLPGENKAEFLAKGIYIALVTTLAGLCVAIPAAFFSHMFEGRIQNLFHSIDELLFNLMPQIERYEGRVRFSRQMDDGDGPVEPPPVPEGASLSPPLQPPREPRELAGQR